MKAICFMFLTTLALPFAELNAAKFDVNVNGDYRFRYETDKNKGFNTEAEGNDTMQQRARLGAEAKAKDITAVVQVHNARDWERKTSALDLHQGYLSFDSSDWLNITVGRQELNYDNGRIISNKPWSHAGQAFDAIKASISNDDLKVDLVYSKLAKNQDLVIAWLNYKLDDWLNPSLIVVNNNKERTAGAHLSGGKDELSYSAEAYMSMGEKSEKVDHGGMLLAVGLGYEVSEDFSVGAFFEQSSGDDAGTDDKDESFSRAYGSVHKFNGIADRITSDPRGVTDMGGSIDMKFMDWNIHGAVHKFAYTKVADGAESDLGMEFDFVLSRSYFDHLNVSLAAALSMAGEANKPADNEGMEQFIYLQLDAAF